MITLSERARQLTPSATLGMAAKAAEMRTRGIDVISFSTGEPDFDTPERIKEAAKRSIDRGFTKYTPTAGIPALREAIAAKFKRDNDLSYQPDEITVTCGAKQAIANALLAIVNGGDEVIVPAPYWVSYPPQILLAGGSPVIVDTRPTNMRLTPSSLKRAITPKTKALILNSPSNPAGAIYTRDELTHLASVCSDAGIAVISDEIYEHLIYDGSHASIAGMGEGVRALTVVVGGVSKGFAMTGWRLGWAAGPKELIAKMTQMAGQQTTNTTSFVQEAAIEALTGPMDDVHAMVETFRQRRDRMAKHLNAIPGIVAPPPPATFYLFPDMRAFIGRRYRTTTIESDLMLAEILLADGHIATVAGTPFGAPGYLRFSFATSMENIDEGMARLTKVLTEIAQG